MISDSTPLAKYPFKYATFFLHELFKLEENPGFGNLTLDLSNASNPIKQSITKAASATDLVNQPTVSKFQLTGTNPRRLTNPKVGL